jgi:hypothetical protein
MSFTKKCMFKYIRTQSTEKRMTPGGFLDKWFIPSGMVYKRIVANRLKISDKDEADLWKSLLKNMFDLP